jgi:flagellar basal-body rod protein FlgF
MAYGLYISAEGASAQSTRLEHLSNNLANVNTPGFKRDLAVFQARYAEAEQRGTVAPGTHAIDDVGGGVRVAGTKTDYSPGAVKATGLETDMAIRGDGFFKVRRGDQTLLTRAGNFLVDGTGRLQTQDGYSVLDADGSPIRLEPDGGPWHVNPEGTIQQGTNNYTLGLARPRSLGDLVKAGDNLFAPLAQTNAVPPEERQVMSGFLEQSGVNPTFEMMELIETSRAFEANVNMVKNHDQMLSTLIEGVLKGQA